MTSDKIICKERDMVSLKDCVFEFYLVITKFILEVPRIK